MKRRSGDTCDTYLATPESLFTLLDSIAPCLFDYLPTTLLHTDRKRQQIENVRAVAVRNDTVSSVGADVGPVVGHLLEVDLQDNMIWQWKEVGTYTNTPIGGWAGC